MISIGGLFYCWPTKRFFFALRGTDSTHSNTWGLIGGKLNKKETLNLGLQREIQEEIGFLPIINKTIPIDVYESKDHKIGRAHV